MEISAAAGAPRGRAPGGPRAPPAAPASAPVEEITETATGLEDGTPGRDRFDELDFNVYPSGWPITITDDLRGEARKVIDRHKSRTGIELSEQDVIDSPEFVNSSPYDKAWLVKVRLSDTSEVGNLMDSSAYTKYAEEQGGH